MEAYQLHRYRLVVQSKEMEAGWEEPSALIRHQGGISLCKHFTGCQGQKDFTRQCRKKKNDNIPFKCPGKKSALQSHKNMFGEKGSSPHQSSSMSREDLNETMRTPKWLRVSATSRDNGAFNSTVEHLQTCNTAKLALQWISNELQAERLKEAV